MKNRIGRFLFVSTAALGLTFSADVLAQQAQAGAESSSALQEVVVTATKRTSTVQDTPIAITAVTGKELLERGFSDFSSFAQTVPGVSMKSSGAGQTEFEMRGMTSSGGNSATVGFYLDDTPMSAPAAAQNGKVVIDPNLYDLNRVEVLRGPQGTLYGSGSMGGTIKVVTNQPDLNNFDVSGRLIVSAFDGGSGTGGFNNGESGMLNLPFAGGAAALRIVGTYEYDSGFIDRIVIEAPNFPLETGCDASGFCSTRGRVAAAPVGQDFRGVNDEKLTGARATLLVKPTDDLSITGSFLYQNIYMGGLSQIDTDPGTYTNYQPFNSPEPFTDRVDLGSLNIQYHFPWADFTSATSYWNRDELLRQDGTEELQWVLTTLAGVGGPLAGCPIPLPIYANPALCAPGQTTPTPLEDDKSWQTTEEVRLASAGDTDFKWLVGYFYQDFESDWDLYVLQPGAAPIFGTGDAFTQTQPTKIIQNSFFGEVSYRFTPQWTVTAGLRHYHFNNEVTTNVAGYLSSTGSDAVSTLTNTESDQGINPKLNLSYQPNKDLLLYATGSKGFRPGGANQPVPVGNVGLGPACEANLQAIYGTSSFVPAPNTFNPDSVWTYELGEKMRTNDGNLVLNGALYYSKWNDAQQFVPISCGFNFSTNTGDANIYGGELELDAVVAPGLVLALNGAYTHAYFQRASVLPGVIAANGLEVQDVPSFTSTASLAYRTPLSNGMNFAARIENTYVTSRQEVTFALYTIPAYDLTNLRAGVEGDRWSAMMFVNNFSDRLAQISNAYQINVGIATFQRAAVAPPRTIGLEFNYKLR
jgi:iron complex outermembrane receptor protein